jgi:LuxR family maltose regulon positive regulatory protein
VTGIGPFQVDAEFILFIAWLEVLISTGQPSEALEALDPAIAFAREKGLVHRVMQFSVLQAQAWIATGNAQRARDAILGALMAAQPEGYVNIFNRGPGFTQWVAGVAYNEQTIEIHDRLLAAFGHSMSADREPGQIEITSLPDRRGRLVEPLSEREYEVLRCLVDGRTLAEVARRLYLSPNTLKAHTQNIYSKLGVHSRMAAVSRARELGIL